MEEIHSLHHFKIIHCCHSEVKCSTPILAFRFFAVPWIGETSGLTFFMRPPPRTTFNPSRLAITSVIKLWVASTSTIARTFFLFTHTSTYITSFDGRLSYGVFVPMAYIKFTELNFKGSPSLIFSSSLSYGHRGKFLMKVVNFSFEAAFKPFVRPATKYTNKGLIPWGRARGPTFDNRSEGSIPPWVISPVLVSTSHNCSKEPSWGACWPTIPFLLVRHLVWRVIHQPFRCSYGPRQSVFSNLPLDPILPSHEVKQSILLIHVTNLQHASRIFFHISTNEALMLEGHQSHTGNGLSILWVELCHEFLL